MSPRSLPTCLAALSLALSLAGCETPDPSDAVPPTPTMAAPPAPAPPPAATLPDSIAAAVTPENPGTAPDTVRR